MPISFLEILTKKRSIVINPILVEISLIISGIFFVVGYLYFRYGIPLHIFGNEAAMGVSVIEALVADFAIAIVTTLLAIIWCFTLRKAKYKRKYYIVALYLVPVLFELWFYASVTYGTYSYESDLKKRETMQLEH